MAKFVFAYHGGGMPEDMAPEDVQKVMAAWEAWMGGLGSALLEPGNPTGDHRTVTSDGVTTGGGANPLTGFSIVEAASIDEAVGMAKGCPILDDGGSVEVAQAFDM